MTRDLSLLLDAAMTALSDLHPGSAFQLYRLYPPGSLLKENTSDYIEGNIFLLSFSGSV